MTRAGNDVDSRSARRLLSPAAAPACGGLFGIQWLPAHRSAAMSLGAAERRSVRHLRTCRAPIGAPAPPAGHPFRLAGNIPPKISAKQHKTRRRAAATRPCHGAEPFERRISSPHTNGTARRASARLRSSPALVPVAAAAFANRAVVDCCCGALCFPSVFVRRSGQLGACADCVWCPCLRAMDDSLAFVTPASAARVHTAAARRATAVCRRPPRSVPVMKKVRRKVTTGEEDNAVDVFGGTKLSQEELLAAALGEEPAAVGVDADADSNAAPVAAPSKKKKKKPKKGAVLNDDANAVDVFGGASMSQEELLAAALGEDTATAEAPSSAKNKKKSKTPSVLNDDANAVDVFASPSATQEQLLADALGEQPQNNSVKQSKKKKKSKGKNGVPDDSDNAVDVFSGTNLSQEELLAQALGESPEEEDKQSQKKKKGKNQATAGSGENGVDVFGSADPSKEELLDNSLQAPEHHSANGVHKSSKYASNGSGTTVSMEADLFEDDDDELADEQQLSEEAVPEPLEDKLFEPDTEVVGEFEDVSKQFRDFTSAGRRQKMKETRTERNAAEGRLADVKYANFGSGGEKFTSVRLEDVTMIFRNTTVLQGVTWGVRTGERVGLIGENGSGKTTQLRIIAGLLKPTSGEVVRSSKKTRASFLRQEFVDELDPTRTLREEFYSAFHKEMKLAAEYTKCERDIATVGDDMESLERLLNLFEDLRQQCEESDVWNLDARIDRVMPGLGFSEDDSDKLVASFSGGWKVRIGLGKVLLQDPDLLLLDEPSNHLDSESVEWLEEFLRVSKLPMVVVSHDREFLDKVCTKIVDIEAGEAFEYPGNYSTFVKLKKEQRKAWESAYERQQKFIKEQQIYIKRNRRVSARSSQVKSREKMLERMERTGQIVRRPPRQGKPLVFRFPPAPRSGRDCIVIDDLTHGYGGRTLFQDASIAIERGDRIALIGPNGSGKSTLLRLIVGLEEPQSGSVDCQGLTNIKVAYYEQNQADALDLEVTVLDTLTRAAPTDMRYEDIRALLGKFLFKGDAVEKKVSALSGGEKARLALAKIMLEPANVLVLDEPGNHLSISAKEMLEEALQHFQGTLLLVSHDRYLISQVATQILAVEDKSLVLYDGDYKAYMEKHQELREKLQARFIPGVSEIKSAPKIVVEEPLKMSNKKEKRKKNFGGSGIHSGKTKEMNAKRWN
ncbi:ABC transporter [Gracilaria domingensis]|nr:ABC transporter [Gracilaria domingensis]